LSTHQETIEHPRQQHLSNEENRDADPDIRKQVHQHILSQHVGCALNPLSMQRIFAGLRQAQLRVNLEAT
jgi:hypothetical protein